MWLLSPTARTTLPDLQQIRLNFWPSQHNLRGLTHSLPNVLIGATDAPADLKSRTVKVFRVSGDHFKDRGVCVVVLGQGY
jgi:hypothetical protein